MGEDQRVVRGDRFELVGGRDERQAGEGGDAAGERFGEARIGVQAGADRRRRPAPKRSRPGSVAATRRAESTCAAQPENSWPRVIGVASCRWVRPILTMSAKAALFAPARRRGAPAPAAGGDERQRGGDVHRARERIVRRLPEIDVVVGVDRRLVAAPSAKPLVGEVGDHLVDIHVGLGARAGLPHLEREFVVARARPRPPPPPRRSPRRLRRQQTELGVGQRRRLL